MNEEEDYVYLNSYVHGLEHELALARASSSYWREKYIEKVNRERLIQRKVSDLYGPNYVNALYWFERAARSPMDECDE